ncbi:ABC-2 family transporter protein [Candidatus Daviesbacteria bacterium]|nr:ABC-2 family transporter protein [Candidatus Daviesbacteria bacterium]
MLLSLSIGKYWAIFKVSWENGLVYRVNFLVWRIRSILGLLLVYFIWWTTFQNQDEVFGYSRASMLTYIMVAAIIRAVILSSRVMDVSTHINEGYVVNFLVKPLNFISFYFARDLADKLMNIALVIVEILLLVLVLKPPLVFQTDPLILSFVALAIILGIVLYFLFAFIVSLLAFWLENTWGSFFLVFVFLESLGGGIFPIDILPKTIANILLATPFPYFIYFPSKIYTGTMEYSQIIQGFIVLSIWLFGLWLVAQRVLSAGLKKYTAFGY